MKCTHARDLMSPLLDGELEAGARGQLAGHLAACAECRAAYSQLEQVHALFARAERHTATPAFTWRVMAATRAREPVRRPLFPFALRLAAQTAMIAAVVAAGVASGRLLSPPAAGVSSGSTAAMFSLEIFDAAPPDSPGGAYLAMMEPVHE